MARERRLRKYSRDLQLQLSQMTGVAPETSRPIGEHMKEIEDHQKKLNVEPWSPPQYRPVKEGKRRLSAPARKLSPTQRTIDQCMGMTQVSFFSPACLWASIHMSHPGIWYVSLRHEYRIQSLHSTSNTLFQKEVQIDDAQGAAASMDIDVST